MTPNKQMDWEEFYKWLYTLGLKCDVPGCGDEGCVVEGIAKGVRNLIDHQAQEVREVVVNEASEKIVRYFKARERFKPRTEKGKYGKDRHMASSLISLLRETLTPPVEGGEESKI